MDDLDKLNSQLFIKFKVSFVLMAVKWLIIDKPLNYY